MAYFGYWILALGTVIGAVVFYTAAQSEYRVLQVRARIAKGFYTTRLRLRGRMNDEQLELLLRQSGLPISPPLYHGIRVGLTALLVVFAMVDVFTARNPVVVFLPVLVWIGLGYRKPMPMYFGFQMLQAQAATARNRSLYLLYRLVYQEILAFENHPLSVNDMLRRQVGKVPAIRRNLETCLDHWIDDPLKALHQFGEELGTEQAKIFAHMLVQIEEAGIQVARDIFENNQDSFRADRVSVFEARLSRRALLASGLTMAGFLAVSYDLQVVIQAYSNAMLNGSAFH